MGPGGRVVTGVPRGRLAAQEALVVQHLATGEQAVEEHHRLELTHRAVRLGQQRLVIDQTAETAAAAVIKTLLKVALVAAGWGPTQVSAQDNRPQRPTLEAMVVPLEEVVVVVQWDSVWPLGAVVVVVQRPLLGSRETQVHPAHPALLVVLETRVHQGPVPIPVVRARLAAPVPMATLVQQEILVPGPRVVTQVVLATLARQETPVRQVTQVPVPIPVVRARMAAPVPQAIPAQQEILVPGPRVAILAPPAMQHQREPMGTSVPQEIPDRPVPRETPRFSIRILSLLVVQWATLVQRVLVARLVLVVRQATLATPAA